GVSGFVIKPVTFESLVSLLKTVSKYWFEIVEPPPQRIRD
ncbi:MAG: response regulator, partial [Desulfobacteria bacterium]